MKWSRENDYRGQKSYGAEAGGGRAAGGLIGAIKAVLAVIAKPTPSPVNLTKSRGYSTLGTRSGLKRPADCPFPTAPANANQPPRS